jgi:deoxyribodipyrimidine photo-lyase
MDDLTRLSQDPRVTVRRTGSPDPGGACVVYWMQRAQRGIDNVALDVAVEAANALHKPVVVFLAPVPFYPNANLRHYRFLPRAFLIFPRRSPKEISDLCFAAFPNTACCISARK